MTPEEKKAQEEIKIEREYTRSVFWTALKIYQARMPTGAPAFTMSDSMSHGSSHDPAWEKWSRWRADFENCCRGVLHGEQLLIYESHIQYEESDPARMPIRDLMEKIVSDYGTGSIGWNLFYATKGIIAEKVGGELLRRGVWPISEYMRGNAA